MSLNTLGERYDFVRDMLEEAWESERIFDEFEDDNDWAGARVTAENLEAIEEMLFAEEIFLDAFEEMGQVRTRDRDEQEMFIGTFYFEGLNTFNETVLLPRLRHALKNLTEWGFRTDDGKKFGEEMSDKLNMLIKKYDGLYDV